MYNRYVCFHSMWHYRRYMTVAINLNVYCWCKKTPEHWVHFVLIIFPVIGTYYMLCVLYVYSSDIFRITFSGAERTKPTHISSLQCREIYAHMKQSYIYKILCRTRNMTSQLPTFVLPNSRCNISFMTWTRFFATAKNSL